MKRKLMILAFATVLSYLLSASFAQAQAKYQAKDNISLTISGTSTMHDWTMKSSRGECVAVFATNQAGAPTGLTTLSFTTPAEGLKSEKSGMDKNAYKALKTAASPAITYTATTASMAADGTVKCMGNLTIAGTTVYTDLVATCKPAANNSYITVTGSKKISMKDYQIEPPSFMMGTIKTGNDITLNFSFNIKK